MNRYIVFDIETTGLNAWFGDKITCICGKSVNKGEDKKEYFAESGNNEREIITKFLGWLKKFHAKDYTLITKNGKMFDIPFILSRCTLNKIDKPAKPLCLINFKHFDLHEITEKRVSLNDMARLLGTEQKSSDGKQAIQLYKDKKFTELKDYCMQDVNVTEQVYHRYYFNRLFASYVWPWP